jgi:hypothetical protein
MVVAQQTPVSQRRWPMGDTVRGTTARRGRDLEGSGRKGLTVGSSPPWCSSVEGKMSAIGDARLDMPSGSALEWMKRCSGTVW